ATLDLRGRQRATRLLAYFHALEWPVARRALLVRRDRRRQRGIARSPDREQEELHATRGASLAATRTGTRRTGTPTPTIAPTCPRTRVPVPDIVRSAVERLTRRSRAACAPSPRG